MPLRTRLARLEASAPVRPPGPVLFAGSAVDVDALRSGGAAARDVCARWGVDPSQIDAERVAVWPRAGLVFAPPPARPGAPVIHVCGLAVPF